MKIAVFAGTTEGRRFSEILCQNKIAHFVFVATEYGKALLRENHYARIFEGRLDGALIEDMLRKKGIDYCIDATHPFATEVTKNIKEACHACDVAYIRIKREDTGDENLGVRYFESHKECAKALCDVKGNILFTTGSKDMGEYWENVPQRESLYFRILPAIESLEKCRDLGIPGKQIVAMQGPFSEELNKALIKDLDIKYLVSKQSGKSGGYFEKAAACMDTGAKMYIIGRPKADTGISLGKALEKLGIKQEIRINLSLVGIGMGDEDNLLVGAKKAIDEADMIIGAKRVIAPFVSGKRYVEAYMPKDILKAIDDIACEIKNGADGGKIAVLFSGDSGFYSGARGLLKEIKAHKNEGAIIDCKVTPGISTVSFFASKLGINYEDANIISIHGRKNHNWQESLRKSFLEKKKTFVLLSEKDDLLEIKKLMPPDTKAFFARDLSMDSEILGSFTYGDLDKSIKDMEEGLFIVCLLNKNPRDKKVSGYINDSEFIRDKVPMTKSGIRTLSIAKLSLKEDSVLFDIGAGSGSVSVEAALLSPTISVFAIEQKEAAVDLIKQNAKKFGVYNLFLVEGKAPGILSNLPMPTHAFIGGSGGNMKEIILSLYEKNPACRVVVNAVSFETLEEVLDIKTYVPVKDFDICQVSVTNTRTLGKYNMMDAQNPVWICEFEFGEEC